MNDYSGLAEIHAECFPKPWSAADFADLKNSGAEIIASENSFIVWRSAAGEAEIITLGVRPSARRGGCASALIGLMERDLRDRGASKIFLEVSAGNAAARKLYEKLGFSRIGIRPKYYGGIDAITMSKEL
jgi:ribosomal-protein-alanine N-acetyltransferase